MRHGGQVLADALKAHEVARVFSVPGESFLAALDGLYDSGIDNIVCRQEGGAAMMAEAYGKLTGDPGVLFVTRGPGATNASSGIHVAQHDGTPMVIFVGQIPLAHRDRGAFQEVDYRAMFAPLAKWVAEVENTDRIGEYVARAFRVARSGRPGPVVLALPEDVLSAETNMPDIAPSDLAKPSFDKLAATSIMGLVGQSKRPLVVAGGSIWSGQAAENLRAFAEQNQLPVTVPFRRQDLMDNRSPCYVGDLGVGMNPKLAKRLQDADCILLLGAELRDIATAGYTLLDPLTEPKTIIQIHPDADHIGRVYPAKMGIVARAPDALAKLRGLPPMISSWSDWTRTARSDYEDWQRLAETPGDVRMEDVVRYLSDALPENAILTNGAGNYAAWVHRYFTFKTYGTQVAPTSGSMGYGFPAAISAKLHYPDRPVICFAGDGCFQMTCNEFSTAVQHGANVITIVANNGRYGTIRMHQEKTYPGRVSGTDLANPDFAAFAHAYGGHGETVTRSEDFADAFQRCLDADKPCIIELKLDSEALATGFTLSEARKMGEAQS